LIKEEYFLELFIEMFLKNQKLSRTVRFRDDYDET